jgi:hypothetical protein
VEGWINGGGIKLDAQDLNEIAIAVRETEAGSGPSMPAEISAEKTF